MPPSASGTSSGSQLKSLKCPICFHAYESSGLRVPRELGCGHTFCTGCLARAATSRLSARKYNCPTCRKASPCTRVLDIAPNYALQDCQEEIQSNKRVKLEQQAPQRSFLQKVNEELSVQLSQSVFNPTRSVGTAALLSSDVLIRDRPSQQHGGAACLPYRKLQGTFRDAEVTVTVLPASITSTVLPLLQALPAAPPPVADAAGTSSSAAAAADAAAQEVTPYPVQFKLAALLECLTQSTSSTRVLALVPHDDELWVITRGRQTHMAGQGAGGASPEPQAVMVGSQLAQALTELHAAGVTVGCLHPSTITLNPLTQVIQLESGTLVCSALAASMQQGGGLHTPGPLLRYTAPEVLSGGVAALSPAADMWAFGCVLFYMLTGTYPWAHKRDEGVVQRVAANEPSPLPAACLPFLPASPTLAALVAACVHMQPAQRPSAQQALQQLAAAASGTAAYLPDLTMAGLSAALRADSALCVFDLRGATLTGYDRHSLFLERPGITVRNGTLTWSDGGGLCVGCGAVTLERMTVTTCGEGGGVHIVRGTLFATDCTFSGARSGIGLYAVAAPISAQLTRCTLQGPAALEICRHLPTGSIKLDMHKCRLLATCATVNLWPTKSRPPSLSSVTMTDCELGQSGSSLQQHVQLAGAHELTLTGCTMAGTASKALLSAEGDDEGNKAHCLLERCRWEDASVPALVVGEHAAVELKGCDPLPHGCGLDVRGRLLVRRSAQPAAS